MSSEANKVIKELSMLLMFMHDPRPKSSIIKAVELLKDDRLSDDPLTALKAVMEKHKLSFQSEYSRSVDESDEICLVICQKNGSAYFEVTHYDNYSGIITADDIKIGVENG